jgi:ketosteroid isomerase-like protein
MKLCVVVAATAVLVVGCAKVEDSAAIKRSLEEKVGQFADAFNKQDIQGLMTDYWNSSDLAVYYPDGNYIGYDALKQSWQTFFQNVSVKKFAITELHTEVENNTAYQWGTYDLSMQPKAGEGISAPGRFTQVWRKLNGKWVIVIDHASVPLPPPPM